MHSLVTDVRHAVRLAFKAKGFTLVALLTLALGIGANTGIFTLVNAVLLAPLSYPNSDRLVRIWDSFPSLGFPKANQTALEFVRLREETEVFSQVVAYGTGVLTVTGRGEPERVSVGYGSANLFSTLGARPALGRDFRTDEEDKARADVVMLSHGYWQRAFSSDPGVIGSTLALDGRSHTIIGVMPAGFRTPPDLKSTARTELWLPLGLEAGAAATSGAWQRHWLQVVGVLGPGRTIEEARAEVGHLIDALLRDYPAAYPAGVTFQVALGPLEEDIVGNVRPALLMLLAAVGLVLLIACANIANLLLARGQARQKEIALRSALGASRWQIVRQLLVESLVLSLAGGALGLLLARLGLHALIRLAPATLPRAETIALDSRVLLFTLSVAVATGVVFGLVPALQAIRVDLNEALKTGGRGSQAQPAGARVRGALVVAEVALAATLLAGAGLLIRSLWSLEQVNPGFNPEGLLTLLASPSASAYPTGRQTVAFYERVLEKAAALPGVKEVTAVAPLPIGSASADSTIQVEGRPYDFRAGNLSTDYRIVAPGYFQTMEIPLLLGRAINRSDSEDAQLVVIVNNMLVRHQFQGENPIGKRIRLLDGPPETSKAPYMTIVGVASDARNRGLAAEVRQEVYVPLAQHPLSAPGVEREMALVVRTDATPTLQASPVVAALWSVDPSVPVTRVRKMTDIVGGTAAQPRFNALLLGLFAGVALLLGGIGIYGVMSFSVEQRTNEIGVRLALGAAPAQVLVGVLREGLTLTVIGLVVGLGCGMAAARAASSLLFGVGPGDPLTFAAVSLVTCAASLAACILPALRATRVDPVAALRGD